MTATLGEMCYQWLWGDEWQCCLDLEFLINMDNDHPWKWYIMISVCFRKKITKCLQTWLLRPGSCQAWDQYMGILPNWLKPLQYISPYRSMCKLHISNLDFKKVMSIYETALWVDGPNIEPALSPYPPRSPHPRLSARTRPASQKFLAGSSPPVGCRTHGAGRDRGGPHRPLI